MNIEMNTETLPGGVVGYEDTLRALQFALESEDNEEKRKHIQQQIDGLRLIIQQTNKGV